mmetsp:Transcript_8454/g.38462  ORF Transcript_8454/g.38462 Transcript_8454/m.38462 type:complete len:221 (+) Transcript_8454:220-882(+)
MSDWLYSFAADAFSRYASLTSLSSSAACALAPSNRASTFPSTSDFSFSRFIASTLLGLNPAAFKTRFKAALPASTSHGVSVEASLASGLPFPARLSSTPAFMASVILASAIACTPIGGGGASQGGGWGCSGLFVESSFCFASFVAAYRSALARASCICSTFSRSFSCFRNPSMPLMPPLAKFMCRIHRRCTESRQRSDGCPTRHRSVASALSVVELDCPE